MSHTSPTNKSKYLCTTPARVSFPSEEENSFFQFEYFFLTNLGASVVVVAVNVVFSADVVVVAAVVVNAVAAI